MFRFSFKVLIAATMLVLAGIVAYVAMRFRGPEEALSDAQAFFDRGDYQRAIVELELNERSASIQGDPTKLTRLLRLRYAANSELENHAGALRDLNLLLQRPSAATPELRLDRIRLLALTGDGTQALQHARTYLAEFPNDGRALELAGEACQTAYHEELGSVFAALDRDLGVQAGRTARSTLLSYLYHPEADVEVQQSLEAMRVLYNANSRLLASWPALSKRLKTLRSQVQEGLAWFQQSLEAGGEPVAAMRGLAMSLDRAERFDDLLALCEGYRAQFSHQYVLEAGAMAAWTHIRAGQYEAALTTTLRWLPPGSWSQRIKKDQPTVALGDLLMARFLAAYRLHDEQSILTLAQESQDMWQAGIRKLPPVSALSWGVHLAWRKDWATSDKQLAWSVTPMLKTPVSLGHEDLAPDLVALRLLVLGNLGAPESQSLDLLREWSRGRPDDLRPRHQLAQLHLDNHRAAAAIGVLDEAALTWPTDGSIFDLRVRAAEELYRESKQDGLGLLAQCEGRRVLVPDVPHPIGYVLCAQAALSAGIAEVARECANHAAAKFPTQRRPRLLRAEAELLAKRPAESARLLMQLLDDFPADGETIALALRAHRQANLLPLGLLAAATRALPPGPELAAELLRTALAQGRTDAGVFVPTTLPELPQGAELRILAAHAKARSAAPLAAEELLAPLAPMAATLGPTIRTDLANAVVALLVALAPMQPDAALASRVRECGIAYSLSTPDAAAALFHGAHELAKQHPETAYALAIAALAAAKPEQRGGADYLLAGNLAARLGQFRLANDHWTAAIAFPDGREAIEPLARLCLAEGHVERAQQLFRLTTTSTDAAMAARLGGNILGTRLARTAVERDGADLLAHTTLAALGQTSLAADAPNASDADKHALLELASVLASKELGGLCQKPAIALFQAHSDSLIVQMLLARALQLGGHAAQAAAAHERLFKKDPENVLLWREVALAADTPGYVAPPEVIAAIAYGSAQGKHVGSPVIRAFGVQRTSEVIAASGNQGIADQLRAGMWLQFPELLSPTLADAEGLANRGRQDDAWWMLERLRPTLRGAERVRCIENMMAIAVRSSRADGRNTENYCAVASNLIREEAPYSCLVHFLLDHTVDLPSLRPNEAEEKRLLAAALRVGGSGYNTPAMLRTSIDRLQRSFGITAAAEAVDEALAANPNSIPLWMERTALLIQLRRGATGIAELRNVLRHVEAPVEQLTLVTLAAANFALLPEDAEQFARLPANLQKSPDGRLARGLIALRQGRAEQALADLEEAGERPDGLHLRALALAQLQVPTADALPRAAASFAELARNYPSSSLARYAGSFSRQFAGR